MANYVDELRLGIKVEDNKSGEKVRSLANAISRLNKVIAQLDPALLKSTFGVLRREMGGLAKEAKSAEKALVAAAKVLRGGGIAKAVKEAQKATAVVQKTGVDTVAKEVQQQAGGTEEAQVEIPVEKGQKRDFANELELLREMKQVEVERYNSGKLSASEMLATKKKIFALDKQIVNATKKSSIQDVLRIARYRLIRTLLSQLTKGIKDFLASAAQQSPEVNKNLSSITSSLTVLQSSLGAIATALLPAIQPILFAVSTIIGTIANGLSILIAMLRGAGGYIKINTNYWKEYNAAIQGTLLSFDTFNTLSTKTELPDLTEKVNFGSGNSSTFWENILSVITAISATALIKWLIGGKIVNFVTNLEEVLTNTQGIKTEVDGISTNASSLPGTIDKATKSTKDFKGAITYAAMALGALVGLFQSIPTIFDETATNGQKVVAIIQSMFYAIALVAGAIAAIMSIVNPVAGALKAYKAIAVASTIAAGLTGMIGSFVAPKAYANGGMFEGAGTMYALAGESGAEVVAQGSAGTGVLNVSQFKQAMLEALYEYGAARGQLDSISVNMDGNSVGRVVAGSNGFRSEAHRRGNGWR